MGMVQFAQTRTSLENASVVNIGVSISMKNTLLIGLWIGFSISGMSQENWIPKCTAVATSDTVIYGIDLEWRFQKLNDSLYHFEALTEGRLFTEFNYVAFGEEEGYFVGDWISYDFGKISQNFHFENGLAEGMAIQYHNGKLVSETPYHLGMRHGMYSRWDTTGLLLEQGEFQNGAKIGEWKRWHPNGQLASIGSYVGTGSYFVTEPYDTANYDYSEFAVLEFGLNDSFEKGWNFEEYKMNVLEKCFEYRKWRAFNGMEYYFPKRGEWRYYTEDGEELEVENFPTHQDH